MSDTRYAALQTAIHDYGAAAFENMCRGRRLGDAILSGYAPWLGCADACVAGVPVAGRFDPRRDYGEACYSFHGRKTILLEPVRFGVSLIVENREGPGALWLRVGVSATVSGDDYDVFVGERPRLRAPLDFGPADLEPVFAALHAEMLSTFRRGVEDFEDDGAGRVGFLTS